MNFKPYFIQEGERRIRYNFIKKNTIDDANNEYEKKEITDISKYFQEVNIYLYNIKQSKQIKKKEDYYKKAYNAIKNIIDDYQYEKNKILEIIKKINFDDTLIK